MKNGLTTVPQIGSGNATQYTESASFAEVVGSSLQYKYGPAFDYIKNSMEFGMSPNTMLPQEGYIPKDNIPTDLRQFASQLLRASNPKQMDHMVTQIRKGQESRRVLAEAGFVLNLTAEFLDPFNYLGIPFIRGASVATNALRGSASVASVTAAQEAIRAPLDPLNTTAEVAINIGAAAILGGAITGLASVPMARRISAQEQATKTVEKLQSEITPNSTNLNAAGSLEAVQPSVAVEPNGAIAENWFTDSIVYKSIVTPLKAIIGNSKYPNSVKLTALKIINDSGILLAANKEGKKIGNSVGQNAKLFDGEWIRNYDEIINIWGDSTGKGVANPMDYMLPKHQKNFESWFEEIDKKAISGIKPANDFEAKVMKIQNDFYEMWQKRLTDVGEIGTTPQYSKMIAAREIRITKAQKRLEGKVSIDQRLKLEASVTRHSKEIDDMKGVIEDLKDKTVMPPNEKIFRPRYWDQKSIKENKENFKNILVKWYTNNPSIISRGKDGKFGRVTLATDSISINRRADETIDTILGIKDILDPEIAYYGAGKSKHFKHRGVDIPNGLVLDFIQTNPVAVMKAYTKRVGPSYEFSRQFNGDSIEDVIDDAYDQMMDAGLSVTEAHKAAKNLRHLHQRLAGNVNRNPESWDQGFAKLLRDLAQLNYLGSAFQAALVEPSKIIMEHGLGPTMKGLFSVLKDNQLKMGAKESRIGAEGVENIMNSAHIRMADDLNNNPFNSDILDKAKQPFYLLNGLGPITKILKDFDAMMRSHTLIDYSVRWTQGKATKMEQEYLLRYNIDLTDANKIASAPWQKSSSGMYMANTDAWTNAIEFPSTTAEIISGPTGVTRKDGSYSPAFYRSTDNKVFIDEEHIIKEMYPLRGWENPRVEGVKAIEAGIINSPDDYVAFIKMHEIMHSLNRPEDLGIFIQPSKKTSKTKPKISIGSKISSLKKRATSLFDEANALEKPSVNSKEFNQALDEANALRLNTIESLNKNVDDIEKASKESQDFYESMQSGFKPDDKQLKEMLEKETKLTSTATNLKQELADIDKSIKSLMTSTETASAIKGIEDSVSPTSQKVDELSSERVIIEGEIQTREFLKESKIDYDDLSDGLKNKASDLAEENYSINNRMDDDGESFLAEASRQEKVFNEKLSKFKKDAKAELKVLSKQKTKESKPVDRLTKEQNAAYENAINDLSVAQFKSQTRVLPETVQTFRSALSGGIMNTILMGTPADKPIITDGIVYIPMRVASQFGMKEDSAFKGYARIENGLLGLPFQFFSYSFAALNKTTAAMAHGQLKSQFVGSAAALGLGYMVLQIKKPEYVEMSFQDQLARAFDYSGLAALHSDLFYTAMSTTLALGGANITGGLLEPRYPQGPDPVAAATGLLGAGPNIGADLATSIGNLLTGNVGEGSKEFIKNLPFARLWFLKGHVNDLTNMLSDKLEEPSGFKRY